MTARKTLCIETVGCQMNMLDSEMIVASLRQRGYTVVDNWRDADTILLNTCSVRQHAEDKIYSQLGRLRLVKQRHPDKVIGVLGCMAQKDQRQIFQRAPFVNLIAGPGQLHQVPDLIEQARAEGGQLTAISLGRSDGPLAQIKRSHETFDPLRDPTMRPTPFQAYLRIQIGCDKFCTYCVVPMTRGPEQGRPPEQIVAEAQVLADQGCKEITLLGQTVNSYQYRDGGQTTRLADLLYRLHEIDGIARLKFVTNYPKDMTVDLLQAVRDLPKVSPYLHVPAQSGSNAVLRRMKRGYTVEDYREMMARIRHTLPAAAISSDFIVGFCGETEDEFQATVELVQECRFKNSFIFKYSQRQGTKAAALLKDDVPEEVKRRRNNELLAIQNQISLEDNQPFVGRTVEVLVEGPSKNWIKAQARRAEAAKRGNGNGKNSPPNQVHSRDSEYSDDGHDEQEFVGNDSTNHENDQRQPIRFDESPDADFVQLTGRTHCDRIVVFDGHRRLTGEIVEIGIEDATAFTLIGRIIVRHSSPLVQLIVRP